MGIHDALRELGLNDNEVIIVEYSISADVSYAEEYYEQEVMQDSGFAETVANLIYHPFFSNDTLEELNEDGLLLKAEAPWDKKLEFLIESIMEDPYEFGFIDHELSMYDFKTAEYTITASVRATVEDILTAPEEIFEDWTLYCERGAGRMVIE